MQQTTNDLAAEPELQPEEEVVRLPDIMVTGRSDSQVGIADSASQGNVGQEQLKLRPIIRPGEVLETVPGLIVSQHSGEGKAPAFLPAPELPAREPNPYLCRFDDGPRPVDLDHAPERLRGARPDDPLAQGREPERYLRGLTRGTLVASMKANLTRLRAFPPRPRPAAWGRARRGRSGCCTVSRGPASDCR